MSHPPKFDLLGFGAVAVDDLLYVERYPGADRKVQVLRRSRQCGGLTGTALVAAARLGARCAYVGVIGRDELSRYVIDSLQREGIDTAHSAVRDDAQPAHSTIVVARRGHSRNIFASLGGLIGADPSRPDAGLIRAAGALLIDHHGLEGTLRAVEIARAHGVAVVADFERDPGGPFEQLLALTDHLIVSRRFARELTNLDDPARAAEALAGEDSKAVVVTCGAEGCWYVEVPSAERAQHVPAFDVEVVDTTGCGDVFHGAYAAELARGEPIRRRIAVATATAALKATQDGGQAGCPSREAVERFLTSV